MKNKTDISIGLVVLVLSVIGFWGLPDADLGGTDHLGPASFPRAVLILLTLLSVALILQGLSGRHPDKPFWPSPAVRKRILLFIGWFLCYIGLVIGLGAFFSEMETVWMQSNMGFLIGTIIYLSGALWLAGRRNWLEIILVACLVPVCIILSFANFFQILLP